MHGPEKTIICSCVVRSRLLFKWFLWKIFNYISMSTYVQMKNSPRVWAEIRYILHLLDFADLGDRINLRITELRALTKMILCHRNDGSPMQQRWPAHADHRGSVDTCQRGTRVACGCSVCLRSVSAGDLLEEVGKSRRKRCGRLSCDRLVENSVHSGQASDRP